MLKLILIIAAVVLVGAVIWSAVSGGDDAPAPATTDPAGQEETNQSTTPDSGEEAGSSNSSNTDETQTHSLTNPAQTSGSADSTTSDANQNPGSDAGDQTVSNIASASGSYIDYQDQAQLDQLADTDRWLNFHAPWCPYCVHLDDDITTNSSDIPAGVTILRVDFDDNRDLKVRYGVTRQTTIVRIDADGNEVDRLAAGYRLVGLEELAAAFGY